MGCTARRNRCRLNGFGLSLGLGFLFCHHHAGHDAPTINTRNGHGKTDIGRAKIGTQQSHIVEDFRKWGSDSNSLLPIDLKIGGIICRRNSVVYKLIEI